MNDLSRNLLWLWDYGWFDCEEIIIPPCGTASEVISAYISSVDFGVSFVGPQKDFQPDLHGPFWRASIAPSDFQLIGAECFMANFQAVRQPEGFALPVSDDQWHKVEDIISNLVRNNQWIFMLCLTEENSERFHDWGFVLDVFREFLFTNPISGRLFRCVIGCD